MQISTGYSRSYGIEVPGELEQGQQFMDRIQAWLEGEDSPLDKTLGYGICFFTFLFLVVQVVRALT